MIKVLNLENAPLSDERPKRFLWRGGRFKRRYSDRQRILACKIS